MRVIIVGAGLVGLSIAEELARRNVEIILLEKGPLPGRESSWAAAGILLPHSDSPDRPFFLDLLLSAGQLFPETVIHLQSQTGLDLGYRASGMLELALTDADEAHLESEFKWQVKAGLRLERVTAAQVRKLEPALDGPIRLGFWWPQVAQIDNRQMVQAYVQLIQKSPRVTLRTGVSVVKFLREGARVCGVASVQERFVADVVINCAGSWAGFDAQLPWRIPTVPVRGQILQFKTATPLVQRIIRSAHNSYLVQRSADKLIVGTTVEQAGYDASTTPAARSAIIAKAQNLASSIATLPLDSEWVGLRPGTPDALPILGRTPLPGLLCATGHYRNGVLLAPLTARLIADLVTTGATSIDLAPYALQRFLTVSCSH